MEGIKSGLLTDTLNLVQLARETALAKGRQAQAQRLSPVVDELKTLVTTTQNPTPVAPSSTMAQNDFKTLLQVASKGPVQPTQSSNAADRNRMVLAMASASMPQVDIARQFGMTTDEVRLVVSASQKGRSAQEVQK